MSSLRSRLFKNANKDADELRRRRQDQSLELRKLKKEEQLQKRRNITAEELEDAPATPDKNKENLPADYDEMVKHMSNPDHQTRFSAIQQCRKALSRARNPPIDEFYNRDAIKVLIDNLVGPDDIVFEACWALTNIASGETRHTQAVVKLGGVNKLISLLSHESDAIAEQSIWALGNIAGDCAELRDVVIQGGIVDPAVKFLNRVYAKPTMVSNVAWLLSNLCRNKNPSPPRAVVVRLLPVLKDLLRYPSSSNVIVDSAWAIAYASDAANSFIDDILKSGVVPILIGLLSSGQTAIISPALRSMGNLVIGDDNQTQQVIDFGLLPHVPTLLNSSKSLILKETCWMLSNITAGTESQISAVIHYNIIPSVIALLQTADFKVQKEACWVITNMIVGGNKEHCYYLFSQNVIPALAQMLTVSDAKIVKMVIESFHRLFTHAKENGDLDKFAVQLENCEGLDSMELLQDHQNEAVYSGAYKFIEEFFSEEASGETEAATNSASAQPEAQPDEFQFQANEVPQNTNFDF